MVILYILLNTGKYFPRLFSTYLPLIIFTCSEQNLRLGEVLTVSMANSKQRKTVEKYSMTLDNVLRHSFD